jgi:hypothetical protein
MQLIYIFPPDELPRQPTTLHVDEDFWQNPVAPIPLTLQRLDAWAFEQGEDANNLETALVFDEWQSLVQPLWCYPLPQLFTSEEPITAPAAILGIDEDFLVTTTSPIVYALPRVFTADDEIVPTPPNFDEDFWVNAVAPVWTYPAIVFLADDVIQFAPPIQDEDVWQSYVAPVAASIYLRAPDVDELPGVFFVTEQDVVGVGTVALVSGTGIAGTSAGVGVAVLPSGTGRVN